MTAYTVISHPVKDFGAWKAVFDKYESLRKEGGELSAVVLQHSDDLKMVTVINTWDSVEVAQTFLGQLKVGGAMEESGITAPPTIIFANEA